MISFMAVFGWIAIGAAASLAAMILPFRRGAAGVVWNFGLGVGGAMVGGLAAYLGTARGPEAPHLLAFAAVGSVGALALAHLAWSLFNRHGDRRAVG